MSSRKKGSLLKVVFTALAWILVLSAFEVTLGDIIAFDWFDKVTELLTNFFTL